ncbi:MAG: TIGR00268 family protein [Candidatus Lambdaproteobacteria bacterium RIFOXYD2_FULL_50_16]|uniref:TIGR00268 family protein n=1 Tax=Candidatus Lambdaproteobacteria bacterium RIFOXYD2_FULL_50_16 TaxID=1817772 RepID=A0A1F6G5Z1_9PROT|nr:MAG: TIGR00268 family protein [Candidatus Lambdaproteobacteria bacterium RIFOXYD2_FULL_50_16]
MSIGDKDRKLTELLSKLGRVVVCYSGGVDSSFLLLRAQEALGHEVTAAIVKSESFEPNDYQAALDQARQLGVKLVEIEVEELAIAELAKNDSTRCYHCKTLSFGQIREQLKSQGAILDGTNADDLGEYRPGLKAKTEKAVLSPLAEVGLTKSEIRQLAKDRGLKVWDKPSSPCLNSRIPYGQPITKQKLEQVAQAELVLRKMGFKELRVRHHGDIARIEVPPKDFTQILSHKESLQSAFKALGFLYVTLDLAGFRSGSLNEGLELGA